MPDEPSMDIVKAIVDRLPVKEVYGDALKEPAREISNIVTDLLKTVRLVLAPFQVTVAVQDRVIEAIDRSIRRVPEQQRIPPAPQILGPVLEGIRYEPEDTPIYKMFSELLSRAMDDKRVSEAHPSYPYLIRQLPTYKALLLKALYEAPRHIEFISTDPTDFHLSLIDARRFTVEFNNTASP
jgi:hypothetical protein